MRVSLGDRNPRSVHARPPREEDVRGSHDFAVTTCARGLPTRLRHAAPQATPRAVFARTEVRGAPRTRELFPAGTFCPVVRGISPGDACGSPREGPASAP